MNAVQTRHKYSRSKHTDKQDIMGDLRSDYIKVQIRQDGERNPIMLKAYQLLEIILDNQLSRLEK